MRLLRSRYAGLFLFALVFVAVSCLLRVALLVRSFSLADTRPLALASAFALGVFFDALTCLWFMLPLTVVVVLGANRFLAGRIGRTLCLLLFGLGVFLVLYDVAVEWFFWGEFPSSRFNLVAVDYLHDFRVVLAYVWQNYPVLPVSGGLAVLTLLIVLPLARTVLKSCQVPLRAAQRVGFLAIYLAAMSLAVPFVSGLTLTNTSDNWTNNNLAKNGALSFVSALCNRDVTYGEELYLTRDQTQVMTRLRGLLRTANSQYVSDNLDDVTRKIDNGPGFARHNVIIVVVESLSAEFLGVFGNPQGLTPNLDELAGQGILFTRLYACGNRTIRGLEALNLSLPPTPGRALGKRPNCDELFSAERLFRDMGYRTLFFYGGKGTFDNMDAFLCQGGFELIDRRKLNADEIHFGSAWGVCDGDVYRRVIRECDATHQSGRQFFSMVLTLSNHVPFTYPQEIDIPSGTGVPGAVKYTDFALGRFIREAREKPWFEDTIFAIVADHCSRRFARSDSSPVKYHIPAIIYAPKIVRPRRCESLCSQSDLLPTVLGLLNASYQTKFFGRDVLREPADREFVGTELNPTLLVNNHQVVLLPGRGVREVALGPDGSETQIEVNPDELDMAIFYYQGAGYLLKNHLYHAK
jgi:phosphoglycerol transferase MdoB-like AlkP superfamily enzyme